MKNRSLVQKNRNNSAADSQAKPCQGRAGEFTAREFKVVALRECPLPDALLSCDTPEVAANYWRLNVETNPYFTPAAECLVVLLLDAQRRPMGHQLVGLGTLDAVLADARTIFRSAIIANAAAIIMMHHHPSGDPSPSDSDVRMTKKMGLAGAEIGVEVLDHIIMGRPTAARPKDFCSLRDLGYFCEGSLHSPRKPRAPRRYETSILLTLMGSDGDGSSTDQVILQGSAFRAVRRMARAEGCLLTEFAARAITQQVAAEKTKPRRALSGRRGLPPSNTPELTARSK